MRKVCRRGVAAGRAKGKSLCARLAPSSGAQGSNGSRGASGLEWTSTSVSSRRVSDRGIGRSRALSQRRSDRQLRPRCPTAAAIGQEALLSGSPTIPFGNARLRKALWMVVLNAVRCNPWQRQYYERLRAAGKPGKVAVVAAMRKLLTAVWSVATHRKAFVPIMRAPITKTV
jgi:hypothetical protein